MIKEATLQKGSSQYASWATKDSSVQELASTLGSSKPLVVGAEVDDFCP